MAYIDKIYGSREQWNQLHAFLVQNKPEYIDKYLYSQPEDGGDDYPIANFSREADKWLWKNCSLDFVKDRLLEQYSIEKLEKE